ncbi:MAG: tetratricopeptide repeat protein [Pseudomonadota bacterium]|nr:tetratricopeptide repeat protein [Pseudomonadota bacterium]
MRADMITRHMPIFLVVIIISLGAQTAFGAGVDGGYAASTKKPAGYNEAVALIAAEKYQEAIPPLQSAEKLATTDADIQNLLGFTHRKTGRLDAAASYYKRALEIDPKHKGALEYQGELFLMRGEKDAAYANLEKLDKICWMGCSEYDVLKKAIAELQ